MALSRNVAFIKHLLQDMRRSRNKMVLSANSSPQSMVVWTFFIQEYPLELTLTCDNPVLYDLEFDTDMQTPSRYSF